MRLAFPLVVSVVLFSLGVYGILARRNAILVLMAVELMLNAANLNIVTFDAYLADALHSGQALALFVITIAAAEIGIGLAIILLIFRNRSSADLEAFRSLDERAEDAALDSAQPVDVERGDKAVRAPASSEGVA